LAETPFFVCAQGVKQNLESCWIWLCSSGAAWTEYRVQIFWMLMGPQVPFLGTVF